MSPLKLAILALANRDNGGVFQYTQSMIDALSLVCERDVTIVAREPGYHPHHFHSITADVPPSSGLLNDLARSAATLTGTTTSRFLSRRVFDFLQQQDVILCPAASPIPTWLDRPFIATIHDFQERHHPEFFSWKERIRRRVINRGLASKASYLLCESRFVANDISRYAGAPNDRIRVIPAPPPRRLQRETAPATHHGEYLFYPAQFWPHKNHATLFQALRLLLPRHPNLKILLTGNRQKYSELLEPLAAQAGVESRVECLGYVSEDDLEALYRGAVALVMPSLFESISIPVYEAFELGVPVIASDVTAIPEQVGGAGLIFRATDPGDLARKIEMLLSDDSLRETLVVRGKSQLSRLSHLDYGRALMALVQSVSRV